MNPPRTRIEKSLRRSARSLIRSQPSQLKEYRRQRRSILREVGPNEFLQFFVPPVFLIGFMLGVAGFAASNPEFVVRITALIGLLGFVTALGFANGVLQSLSRSHFLSIQSVLPVPDQQVASVQLRLGTTATTTMLCGWLAYPVCLAALQGLPVSVVLSSIGLGILFWLTTITLTMVILSWMPKIARPRGVAVICFGLLFLVLASEAAAAMKWVHIDDIASVVNSVIPTSWALTILLSLTEPNPEPLYWLYLIPAFTLVLVGFGSRNRICDNYRITDLELQSDGSMQATDYKSLTVSMVFQEEQIPEVDRQVAQELVHYELHDFRYEFECSNWIENKIWRSLDPDERTSLLAIYSQVPSWTMQFKAVSIITAIALSGAFVFSFFASPDAAVIAVYGCLSFGLIFIIGAAPAVLWNSRDLVNCTSTILLPVSDQHLNRISMMLGTIRAIGMFPFGLVGGALLAHAQGRDIEFLFCVLMGAKTSLFYLASHQWWYKAMQPYDADSHQQQQALEMILLLATLGGCALLFWNDDSQLLNAVATCIIFGSGHLAYRSFRRRKLKRPVDFIYGVLEDEADT
jgi:hypothetical protein